jgi:hypothetical protein
MSHEEHSSDPQTSVDETLQALIRRFAEAECSWLSSTRSDGRAHNAPVWHVWRQGRVYVITMAKAVKTTNIMNSPGVVIAHPDPVNPIIIEGWATLSPEARQVLQPLFKAKYDWDLNASPDYDTIIEITPVKLIAWGKYGEGRWSGSEIAPISSP